MAKKRKKKKPTAPAVASPTTPPRAAKPAGPGRNELQRLAQRRAQRREALRRAAVTGGLIAAAVAVVATFVVIDRRGDAQLRDALTAGSCDVDTLTDRTRPAGQNHVPNPTYEVDPPAGGDHLPSAAPAGVYAGTSVPGDGLLVHSLEHGYVVAWHRPDLPSAQLERLEAFASEHEDDVIVVERARLPVPVAATAWGQRLLCQEVEVEPLQRFFDEHVGNGPEDVARG